jgi:tryptophanase
MTVETQAAFARRIGVTPGYVSMLKSSGRLVMTDDGKVDVEKSIKLIKETGGAKPWLAERHAAARGRPVLLEVQRSDSHEETTRTQDEDEIGNTYQAARAVKEKYLALQAKLAYEEQSGNLIPKEHVEYALKSFATSARVKLEVLADQLAPEVAPITDIDELHALLSERFRDVAASIADDMARTEAELRERHV